MGKVALILTTREVRERAMAWVAKAPHGAIFTLAEKKRSIPQNSRLWAMLTDVARQATWAGKKRTTEDWKDLFTAAVKTAGGDFEAVPGLDGGLMILGLRTSEMSTAEMSDLQTFIESWSAQNGVTLSDFDAAEDGAASAAPRAA